MIPQLKEQAMRITVILFANTILLAVGANAFSPVYLEPEKYAAAARNSPSEYDDRVVMARKERVLLDDGQRPVRGVVLLTSGTYEAVRAEVPHILEAKGIAIDKKIESTTKEYTQEHMGSREYLRRIGEDLKRLSDMGVHLDNARRCEIWTRKYGTVPEIKGESVLYVIVVDGLGVLNKECVLIAVVRYDDWYDWGEVRWTNVRLPFKGPTGTTIITESEINLISRLKSRAKAEILGCYFPAHSSNVFRDVPMMERVIGDLNVLSKKAKKENGENEKKTENGENGDKL